MAISLIRAGSHGEYEQKFIQEGRVYATWGGLKGKVQKELASQFFRLRPWTQTLLRS